jgi:hypothetical protein
MNMNSRKTSRSARFVVPALLLIAMGSGVAYWADFSGDAGAAARASKQAEMSSSVPASFDYFPAQYVNQAQEREETVPSF